MARVNRMNIVRSGNQSRTLCRCLGGGAIWMTGRWRWRPPTIGLRRHFNPEWAESLSEEPFKLENLATAQLYLAKRRSAMVSQSEFLSHSLPDRKPPAKGLSAVSCDETTPSPSGHLREHRLERIDHRRTQLLEQFGVVGTIVRDGNRRVAQIDELDRRVGRSRVILNPRRIHGRQG